MTKILFLSDAHIPYKHNPITQHLQNNNDNIIDKKFIQTVGNTKQSFLRHLEKAKSKGPYDHIFCLGDMIHGYKEQGINTKECLKGINELKNILHYYFPRTNIKYLAGGHELGYIFPLAKDPDGGLNEESIKMFEKHFNDLYFSFKLNKYTIIGLSSDIEFYNGDNRYFIDRKNWQRIFLKKVLKNSLNKIILLVHDPEVLTSFDALLEDYDDRIFKTYAGHFHANWIKHGFHLLNYLTNFKILKKSITKIGDKYAHNKGIDIWHHFHNKKNLRKIEKKYKLQIIPAPSGMKGFGNKLVVLNI